MRLRALIAMTVAVAMLAAGAPRAAAATVSYSVDVSWSGTVQVGDTVTLTPIVSGVAPGTPVRCDMWIEDDHPLVQWVRMQVASDGCEPWTLTVPPSLPDTYTISGRASIGMSGGNPISVVLAPDKTFDIVDGGTPLPFATNYPVQAWDLDSMISTRTPTFGDPITIHPPATAEGCELRILGGYEASVTDQYSGCHDWTFTIPKRNAQGPLNMFGESADVHVTSWTGASSWADQRADAALVGAMYGETYNTTLGFFIDGPNPTSGYASNIPAMFAGLDRAYTALAGDPSTWSYTPIVVGSTTGTCTYDVGLFDGETYAGPTSSPVGIGACQDAIPVPPYLGPYNADRTIRTHLVDDQGRVLSTSGQDVGYIQPMDPVDVTSPPSVDPGATVPIDASTDTGVPAAYEITMAPEPLGPNPALLESTAATVIASGYFDPSISSVGDAIATSHVFSTPGRYRITATFTDVRGSTSTGSAVVTVGADTTAPTTTPPAFSFVAGATVDAGRTPTRSTWTGADAGSGIARYEAAVSTDGGAYVTVATSLSTPSLSRALSAGHTYRLRVRAVDHSGNIGAWSYGTSFRISAYQESSSRFTWTGAWYRPYSTSDWLSYERYARTAGAKVSFTFSGRALAWVGSVGPTRGSAKVYVNGAYLKTVNLYAIAYAYRRVITTLTWSTAASRKITIVVVGTTGHPRVDLDAFVTAS